MFDVTDFQSRYPEMTPYVGSDYIKAKEHGCALLVIGESHYLPDGSTIHQDCDTWYASNHTKLNNEEKIWISTRDIITVEMPKDFPNQAHGIWKYGYREINRWGPVLMDYRSVFRFTVFYNFYLRPANQGKSFNLLCKPLDIEIANIYFNFMFEQYKPNGIVFLSRFAFDTCDLKNKLSVPIGGAPHPTCQWWNKKSGKYGGRLGRELVGDGMKGMDWSWANKL